jgi:hypothetical protein
MCFRRGWSVLLITFAAAATLAAQTGTQHYVATLTPLNAKVAGSRTHGVLRMMVSGDTLTVNLQAQVLSPGMMHMAHLHGFENGAAATCPTAAADTNHDGVIDLKETEAASGVTLIPFNADPAALDIPGKGYPTATKEGHLSYKKTVSIATLDAAMAKAYHGAKLDLDKRVVYIHGVPPTTKLPATAASLPGVPAQATLPIACGVVELVP